jgi:hypothetical protein
VVTATNVFGRSIGSAVGVAVFGAIANTTLTRAFDNPPVGTSNQLPHSADDAELVLNRHSGTTGALRDFVRGALDNAAHHVFIALLVVAVLTVAAIAMMPKRTEQLQFD